MSTHASEPVERPDAFADRDREPEEGIALCLSGGGYRAMLFHVGVLWRLNEAGLLGRLDRVSSVSGGSITAATLALHWDELDFDDDGVARGLDRCLVTPIRTLAEQGIDISSVLVGIGLPFRSVADRIVKAYRRHLFGNATLQDLPDEPRFVINATNLESGVLMRFSKPYLADYRVGRVLEPRLPLAVAVAASSAFPPFLSPCKVDLEHENWSVDPGALSDAYRQEISLSDGGVYDNLGLETAWKRYRTILVSDAGGQFAPDPSPPSDWLVQLRRVLAVIDNQVRSLRKQQAVDSFRSGVRQGMYVGIRSRVAKYPVADPLAADPDRTRRLAEISTRLDELDDRDQEELINWGYIVADAGLRSHVDQDAPRPTRLPYPDRPLG
jgi:NTE family protein